MFNQNIRKNMKNTYYLEQLLLRVICSIQLSQIALTKAQTGFQHLEEIVKQIIIKTNFR